MFSLEGKVAVIMGAASGIGAETARRFTAAGARVVLADLADASAEATGLGGYFFEVDVTDEASVQALVASSVRELGRLDVMVNNAGVILTAKGVGVDSVEETRRMNWSRTARSPADQYSSWPVVTTARQPSSAPGSRSRSHCDSSSGSYPLVSSHRNVSAS